MIISVLLGLVLVWGQMMTCTTAQGQECIHGEIRTVTEGDNDFIQFCVNGEWRLHCTGEYLWRSLDINVACKQLGYAGAAESDRERANSSGAARTDKFFRFRAQCNGTENNVRECGGEVQELTDCPHTKLTAKGLNGIAACQPVNCTNEGARISLMNGYTEREGRVEVCLNGRWRTVCNNSQEGLAGAVCAKLGLSPYRASVKIFSPSTQPRLTCMVQSDGSIDPLLCNHGACDLSPSLGVVCKSFEETADDILKCEVERKQIIIESRSTINALNQTVTESRETINTLNATIRECRANIMMIVEIHNETIATINTTLQQNIFIVNELQENVSTTNTALQQCLSTSTDTSVLSTPAVGAIIGLLLALLMIAVVGWIVTYIKLSRSSVPRSKNTVGIHKNESYSVRQAVYNEATQDTYSSPSRNYDMVITNTDDLDTYDIIDHSQQAPPTVQMQPVNHTPMGASKKDDDFYDAEEHTYEMADEAEDQPNYENAESLRKVLKE